MVAIWLSGNALALINVVALHQTRLVPGWVTGCGQVNQFLKFFIALQNFFLQLFYSFFVTASVQLRMSTVYKRI